MITETEIETLGRYLSDIWVADDTAAERLDRIDHDLAAVITRAQDISFDNSLLRGRIDESTSESLTRLARATGCPLSEPIIPWLQERSLIVEIEDGWRFKVAKPHGLPVR